MASEYKKAKNLADKWFSRYIRLRDSNKLGIVQCVTCEKYFHFTQVDCGHFIQRDRLSVRFNEKNAHAQCHHCNRFRSGNQFAHGVNIDKIHGQGTAELLQNMSKLKTKFTAFDLKLIAKDYRLKYNKVKNEKGFRFKKN